MRRLTLASLTLLFVVPAVGHAESWRPSFLDLGDEIVKPGPTKIISLRGFDAEKEVITSLSASPDGNFAAVVIGHQRSLILQVVDLKLTGRQSRLPLGETVRLEDTRCVRWAPNSKALMVAKSKSWASEQVQFASFPFHELTTMSIDGSWLRPTFSPDGSCVAYLLTGDDVRSAAKRPGLYYFDLAGGREVFCDDVRGSPYDWTVVGWTNDDRILLVTSRDTGGLAEAPSELVAVSLAGQPPTVQPISWSDPEHLSPDGKYYFTVGVPAVYAVGGTERTSLSDDLELRPMQWDPKGRFLLAWRSESIKDENGRVHKELGRLWFLKLPQKTENDNVGRVLHDHLLVVVDAQIDRGSREAMAAVTGDRRRLVYVADNQLRVKELTALKGEQAALVRREYEQRLQAAALRNSKQIAMAFLMYADDWEGKLPRPETVVDEIRDYLRAGDELFRHPELPEMMCLEYHPPEHLNMNAIVDPAATALGWLDWGRGWRVFIFADGHCEVVDKAE